MISQIYEKSGHIVADCYNRYNKNFNQGKQVNLVFEEEERSKRGFWVLVYWVWGNTHVTVDFGNLSLASPYEGRGRVKTTDGSGMEILHSGSSKLSCKNRILYIKDLLHIPATSNNLLSLFSLFFINLALALF